MRDFTIKTLFENMPEELKQLVFRHWKIPQRPDRHPEGNTLKHIISVINRAINNVKSNTPGNEPLQDDINLIFAALFHDLGKEETASVNPKTGYPTAYGHEAKAVPIVAKYKDYIKKNGGDPDSVAYIVKNHMVIKPGTWDVMKQGKRDAIQYVTDELGNRMEHPDFKSLMRFGHYDSGGSEISPRGIRKEFKIYSPVINEIVNRVNDILYEKYRKKKV